MSKYSLKKIRNEDPTQKNTVAIVITYKPGSDFSRNLTRTCQVFSKVIIVSNGGLKLVNKDTKVKIIVNESNVGIGLALNQGCEEAISQGYKWCVTLDQDSFLYENYFESMTKIARDIENLAILGCNYYDENRKKNKMAIVEGYRKTKTVITSGSLTSLLAWRDIGKFREDFFIDAIDHDFCLRAKKRKYEIYIIHKPLMNHSIGKNRRRLTNIPSHNPKRTYTKSRNTTRLIIEYFKEEPIWSIRKILGLLLELNVLIFFEKKKKIHIQVFFLGVIDGIKNIFNEEILNLNE